MRGIREGAVAEGIGTFALCFIGAGAICTNQWSGGALGLLGIAIAHGTVLAVMISALGHISGGHFNPAVTLGVLIANKIDGRRTLVYILAQLVGAVAAGYLLRFIVPEQAWQPVHLGTPGLSAGVTIVQGMLVETILTFFLVLAVCGTAVDPQGSWNAVAGFGIGTVLIFDILVGGPITGAAMNPARAFGPAVASGYWDFHLIYWLGPVTGGVLAAFLYSSIFLERKQR
ncbi:MAG: aquaporin [Candidatus Omnitrophica bacterium]|nr:aquaporin [Candidatus Omnitrophota bacterium]MBI3020984.1 aquaporin [Candidatus Omnitrophota bacterium]MBI3084112.1 aquaporin [Candidatus Omnitrophota bacterium]